MDSFLNYIGFDPGYLIIGLGGLLLILIILVIILTVKYNHLNKKYEKFMSGQDGKSLEEILSKIVNDNKKVKIQSKNNIDAILEMKKQIKYCFQKIGIVKYDSFRGMAGKLSFVVAVLDQKNNGFIMNCMHTQDGCYTYMKEIIHGEVEGVLSEEEKQALDFALHYEQE